MNGNAVRVGGYPSWFCWGGNAVTYNGTIHVTTGDYANDDPADLSDYVNNIVHQDHEGWHDIQWNEIGGSEFLAIAGQGYFHAYKDGGGHDDVPIERQAIDVSHAMKGLRDARKKKKKCPPKL